MVREHLSLNDVRKLADGILGAELSINPAGVVALYFNRVADEDNPDANMPLATLTNKRHMYEKDIPQCMAEFIPFKNSNGYCYSKGDDKHYEIYIFDTLAVECINGEWVVLPRMATPEIEGLTSIEISRYISRYLRIVCNAIGIEPPKAERKKTEKKPTEETKTRKKKHPSDSPLPGVPKLRAIRPLEAPEPPKRKEYDPDDFGLDDAVNIYTDDDFGL